MTRWVIMLTAMTGQAPRIEAITGMAGLRRRYAPRNDGGVGAINELAAA